MELSPRIYKWFVRPKWFSKLFVKNLIFNRFDFHNKQVLDFGCGIGSNCLLFYPQNYLGVDINAERIHYAQRLYPGYSFNVLSTNELPVESNSVNYILIVSVLHHIPLHEWPMLLQEFRRVLKPQGKIILIEPYFSEKYRFTNSFMKLMDRGKYIQNDQKYINMFKSHNYDIKVLEKYRQLLCYNKILFSAAPIQ